MITRNWRTITDAVHEIAPEYSKKVIESVFKSQFEYVRDWTMNRWYEPRPSILLHRLGTIEIKPYVINAKLRDLIPELRDNPTPEKVEYFKKLWKIRQAAIKYYESKIKPNNARPLPFRNGTSLDDHRGTGEDN